MLEGTGDAESCDMAYLKQNGERIISIEVCLEKDQSNYDRRWVIQRIIAVS